jgi:hypothetical protein
MKKITLLLLATMLVIASIAQFKINYGQVKTPSDKSNAENGIWYRINEAYVYTFKKSPVGIMKAMNMINAILKENGMEYDEYAADETLISSLVKDMTDYEAINLTISIGQSNIERTWVKGNAFLKIILTEELYAILTAEKKK